MRVMRPEKEIIWSYGGGTQSIGILLMIRDGLLPRPDFVVMANTTWEASETWQYTIEHALPIFDELGLRLNIVTANGKLYNKPDDNLPLIPAYTRTGQTRLFCSNFWKRDTILRYLRQQGFGPSRPVIQWIGLSLDEVHRMKLSPRKWVQAHWPLILDHKTYRGEAAQRVLDAGLPGPPKSSCWLCPYRGNVQWRRLYDLYPGDWQNAVQLDYTIREKDDNLFLHREAVPLDQADLDRTQMVLFDGCDGGYCGV